MRRCSRTACNRAAVATLHPAQRIVVFGLGPSAALARYLATMLGRAGRTTKALDASGIALADQMLDLGPGDALLVLAYGRAYREVVALFGEARRMALPVVLVTDSLDRFGKLAQVYGAYVWAYLALVSGLLATLGVRPAVAVRRDNVTVLSARIRVDRLAARPPAGADRTPRINGAADR